MANDSLPRSLREASTFAGGSRLAMAVCGFGMVLLCRRVLPDGAPAALFTVMGLLTGSLCGMRRGLAIAVLAALCDGWLSPPQHGSELLGTIVCWIITFLVLAWAARQSDLLRVLHQQARRDPLTSLPNRQAFFERCAEELSRAKRFQRPLTVVLLDGDDFKAVNDLHGHAHGDRALQHTARILVKDVRPYDLVCRLGGDEFVLLFPETAAEDAARIVVRLQRRLQDGLAEEFAPLTYSYGVATVLPPATTDPASCLAEADRVLYAAKRIGKNQGQSTTISVEQRPQMSDTE